jgi:hypothetical protein
MGDQGRMVEEANVVLDTVVAVGMALSGHPPHRSQRAELPHWAPTSGSDAQALLGIGMQDSGAWQPSVDESDHA